MLMADDAELAAAVDEARRSPVVSLKADWSANGQYAHGWSDLTAMVESVEVERAVTTDLPEETSQVDGYVTAKLTAKLSGRKRGSDQSIARVLSPANDASPLYGVPLVGRPNIALDLGLRTPNGTPSPRQFTGPINTIAPASDGTVEVTALDPSDRLRSPITLPAFVQYRQRADGLGDTHDMNTQWVVDYILRQCGTYASPPPRSDAIISVTGHGGVTAEVGTTGPLWGDLKTSGGALMYGGGVGGVWGTNGPFNLMYRKGTWQNLQWPAQTDGAFVEHFATSAVQLTTGVGVGMHARVYCGTGAAQDVPAGTPAATARPIFGFYPNAIRTPRQGVSLFGRADGGLAIEVRDAARAVTYQIPTPGPARFRFVGLHFVMLANGRLRFTYRLDGVTTALDTPDTFAFSTDWIPQCQINTWHALSWSDFQVWRANTVPTSGPWPCEEHESQADIGVGLNWLTFLPDEVNADAWELLAKVVNSEYGVIGYTELGRFYFKPRTVVPTSGTPVKTIAADLNLLDLGISTSIDSVRNYVTTRCQPGYASRTAEAYVGTEQDGWYWRPTGVSYLEFPIEAHILPIKGPMTAVDPYTFGQNQGLNIYGVVRPNGDLVAGVACYVEQVNARLVRVRVTNNSGGPVYLQGYTLSNNFYYPATGLKLHGYKLEKDPERSTWAWIQSSRDTYGTRTLPLELTDWRQRTDALSPVCVSLVQELYKPVPILTDIPVVGDPRLQLLDVVQVRDPRNLARQITGRVLKINRRATKDEGIRDSLAIRPFASTWPV